MELVFVCLIMALAVVGLAGSSTRDDKIQQMRDNLREIQRFLAYVEEHKSSLPPDVLERFDELDKFCKKQVET